MLLLMPRDPLWEPLLQMITDNSLLTEEHQSDTALSTRPPPNVSILQPGNGGTEKASQ